MWHFCPFESVLIKAAVIVRISLTLASGTLYICPLIIVGNADQFFFSNTFTLYCSPLTFLIHINLCHS